MPLYALAPLLSAVVYAVAALTLKRASLLGAGPWRVAFVTNWVQASLFGLLIFTPGASFTWDLFWRASITGSAFFFGQVFTFLAISRGDVSVTTPVLGAKVIFVAALAVVLTGVPISGRLWGAAALTVAATAMLSASKALGGRQAFYRSLLYGFAAAGAFALTDVLVQKWAPAWGFSRFAPVMFLMVGALSFSLVPLFHEPLWKLPAQTWRWLLPGAILVSVQASGIAWAIMTYGEATMINVLYATRGLWQVVAVWAIGHWFLNDERAQGTGVMLRRMIGASLLVMAVFLVVR